MKTGNAIPWFFTAGILVSCAGVALSQVQQQNGTVSINGRSGEVAIVRMNGRCYVDIERLAQIANGSVGFQSDRVILAIPAPQESDLSMNTTSEADTARLSVAFSKAAIECLAIMKEWRTKLAFTIQHGYPLVGTWVSSYETQTMEGLKISQVSASTLADSSALQLLTNEFSNLRTWSNKLIEERKSMNANISVTPDGLAQDPLYEKLSSCGQFLATMLPSGNFSSHPACD